LYDRVDRWRSSSYLEILAADNLTGIPGAQATHVVSVRFIDGAEHLTDAAEQHLSSLRLDLILVLSDTLVPGAAAACARLGAAGFVLSDHAEAGDAADGLPEVLSGEGLVGVRLELYAAGSTEPTRVIDSVTNADRYSAASTRANAAWHCVPLFERLLNALREGDTARSVAAVRARLDRVRRSGKVSSRGPLGAQLASLAFRYASSRVRRRPDVDQWEMAYQWGAPDAESRHPDLAISNFHPLRPPPDRFWADPSRYASAIATTFCSRSSGLLINVGTSAPWSWGRADRSATRSSYWIGRITSPIRLCSSTGRALHAAGDHAGRPTRLYRAVRLPFEWTWTGS
jgi:hypothetical protein